MEQDVKDVKDDMSSVNGMNYADRSQGQSDSLDEFYDPNHLSYDTLSRSQKTGKGEKLEAVITIASQVPAGGWAVIIPGIWSLIVIIALLIIYYYHKASMALTSGLKKLTNLQCDPGYENKNGLCYKTCDPGYERHPDDIEYCTQKCPADTIYSGLAGCIRKTYPVPVGKLPVCARGMKDINGICYTDKPCPPGMSDDGMGTCWFKPRTVNRPNYLDQKTCESKTGVSCIKEVGIWRPRCTNLLGVDKALSSSNLCTSLKSGCGDGFTSTGAATCRRNSSVKNACPDGSIMIAGLCYPCNSQNPDGSCNVCKSGYTKNMGLCKANCANGESGLDMNCHPKRIYSPSKPLKLPPD